MKTKKISISLVCILLSFTVDLLSSENSWKLKKNSMDIKVFARKIPGSDIDEFMGETIINARIEVLMEVLRDFSNHTRWMQNCLESRILQTQGENSWILFSVTSAPWPLSNREAIFQRTDILNYDSGTATIDFRAATSDLAPKNTGNVRMKEITGRWIFTYIDREHTRAVYTIKADPGGSIPASVANMASVDLPYKTLAGLKKMSVQEQYVTAGAASKDAKIIEALIEKGILKK